MDAGTDELCRTCAEHNLLSAVECRCGQACKDMQLKVIRTGSAESSSSWSPTQVGYESTHREVEEAVVLTKDDCCTV